MSLTAKLAPAFATLVLAVAALAGCTSATAPAATEQSLKASSAEAVVEAEPTPTATGCPTAHIKLPDYGNNTGPADGSELAGELSDTGVREYAVGEPTLNADGQIVSYTVQPGDAVEAIATRFCIDSSSFGTYNKVTYWAMQPGDVLVLRPDPTIPWAPQTDEEMVAVSCVAGYKNGIDTSNGPARVKGLIADFGATAGAHGTVNRNTGGEIESYTAAAGDNLPAVADRFCFDADELAAYNETGPNLNVGTVLVLRPPFEG